MDNNFPMTRFEKYLISRVDQLENKINRILEREIEFNIEEVSLKKAAKIIHKSPSFIEEAVKLGELKTMPYKDKTGKTRYRFRICDLYDWQKSRRKDLEESFLDMFERVAGRKFTGKKLIDPK